MSVTATSDGPVTPTTTLIRKYSNYGTALLTQPVQVADVTLFLQRGASQGSGVSVYVGDVNLVRPTKRLT
jgi:hypothetical protein